jgi:hypothetical protein
VVKNAKKFDFFEDLFKSLGGKLDKNAWIFKLY